MKRILLMAVSAALCLQSLHALPSNSLPQNAGQVPGESLPGEMRTPFAITGKVLDENQDPVSYATVLLLLAADTSLVKGEMTDEQGNFSIEEIAAGNYFVKISFLGYQNFFKEISAEQTNDLGTILLQKDAATLSEVTVTAEQPLILRDNEKIVLNVENTAFSSTGNALDVLRRAPGVIVDNEGNIRLKGKEGVLVKIDGKETYLSPEQLANQLTNMPADALSKVEVISNPGAKYEAEGSAGIINIVMCKNKKQGFNGSITANTAKGELWSYGGGLNLNYRAAKYNLFGNYDYSNDNIVQQRDIWRNIAEEGGITNLIEDNTETHHNYNNTLKAGIDYFINSKNTIGLQASGFFYHEPNDNHTYVDVYDAGGNLQSSSTSQGDLSGEFKNIALNLNYDGTFDTLGRKLLVNLDYAYYDGLNNDNYTTTYYDSEGNTQDEPLLLNNYNPNTVDIKSIKLDYTHPLKNDLRLEAGAKFSYVITDNNLQVSTYVNDSWVMDVTRSNEFRFTENINAGYVNLAKKFGKLSVQAGLRGEQTLDHGNSVTISDNFTRNYFQLFPSASLSYDLNEKNNFTLNYSRRIDRPQYRDLNPFVFYLDQYLYSQGNPNLQPQLTQAVSLSYTLLQQYTFTFDYGYTQDNIISLFYQLDSSRVLYETPDNFDHQHYYDITFFAPIEITKWFNATTSLTAYYLQESTQYEQSVFTADDVSFNGNLQCAFDLPEGISIDISAFYQSAGIWSIATFEAFGSVDAGIKKSLFKGQGSLKLTASDIFNTNHITGLIQYANIDGGVTQYQDARQVTLAFSYRFGKQTGPSREHRAGAEEEKSRVKSGH